VRNDARGGGGGVAEGRTRAAGASVDLFGRGGTRGIASRSHLRRARGRLRERRIRGEDVIVENLTTLRAATARAKGAGRSESVVARENSFEREADEMKCTATRARRGRERGRT
jgi:hypothetical protein